jgi:CRP/FNR family transcriptional regulator, cyclic AMP receptor protein
MDLARAVELLSNTPLFHGLRPADLEHVAAGAVQRSLSKGQTLFREGDDGEALYVVIDGAIKVSVSSGRGDELALTTLGPGDAFGELPLIDEGPRSASAIALTDVVVLGLDRRTLLDTARNHPELLDGLLRSLGRLIRRLTEQAADLVFLDLHARVAKLLLRLAERTAAGDDKVVLDVQLTQTELAEMVGGSRQSVNQALHALERRGYLQLDGRRIAITDLAGLRQRAGEVSG